jgi:hypothetical protein
MDNDNDDVDHVFGSFEGSDGSVEGTTSKQFISFDACNVWGNGSEHDNRNSEELEQGHEVSLESHQQGSNDPPRSPYRVRSTGKQPSGSRFDSDSQSPVNKESPEDKSPAHVPRDIARRVNGAGDGESQSERLSVSMHDGDSQQEKSVKRRVARGTANRTRKHEGDLAALSMHSDDGDAVATRAALRERSRSARHEAAAERTVEEEPEPARLRSTSRTGRYLETPGGSTKKPQRRALATEGSSRRMSGEGDVAGASSSAGPRRSSNERTAAQRSEGKEGDKVEQRASEEGGPGSTPRIKPKRKNSLRNLFPQGKTKA